MGYALFTARKLSLQTQINNYNMQLMQLNNKQQALSNKSAAHSKKNAIIDGKQAKRNAQIQGQKALNQGMQNVGQIASGFGAMGQLVGGGMQAGSTLRGNVLDIADGINSAKDQMVDAQQQAEDIAFKTEIANEQNQIDTERERIQTLLQAASAELSKVKDAEGEAIKNSTPTYVG